MFNAYTFKKYTALMICIMAPAVVFFVGLTAWGLFGGLACLIIGGALSFVSSVLMLRTPFRQMEEGAGIITLNTDSTGIIRPFISSFNAPYVQAVIDGVEVEDIFDRECTFYMSEPVNVGKFGDFTRKIKIKKEIDDPDKPGKKKSVEVVETRQFFALVMTAEEYNSAKFVLNTKPALLWNNQTKSLITKENFANEEKNIFSEHPILYLAQKVKDLSSNTRDFARYIAEIATKPAEAGGLLSKKAITWIGIVLVIIIFVFLLGPSIVGNVGSMDGSSVGTAVSSAKQGMSAIQPR